MITIKQLKRILEQYDDSLAVFARTPYDEGDCAGLEGIVEIIAVENQWGAFDLAYPNLTGNQWGGSKDKSKNIEGIMIW